MITNCGCAPTAPKQYLHRVAYVCMEVPGDRLLEESIKVVVGEDQPVVRWGMRGVLEHEGFKVVAEPDNLPALQDGVAAATSAMLVVCDVALQGRDVLAKLPEMLDRADAPNVMIFSAHADTATAKRALDAGSRGIVSMRAATDTLVHACHKVVRGELFIGPFIGACALGAADASAVTLTHREQDVLAGLAAGETSRQTAYRIHLSPRSVDAVRGILRQKLGGLDRASVLAQARLKNLIY